MRPRNKFGFVTYASFPSFHFPHNITFPFQLIQFETTLKSSGNFFKFQIPDSTISRLSFPDCTHIFHVYFAYISFIITSVFRKTGAVNLSNPIHHESWSGNNIKMKRPIGTMLLIRTSEHGLKILKNDKTVKPNKPTFIKASTKYYAIFRRKLQHLIFRGFFVNCPLQPYWSCTRYVLIIIWSTIISKKYWEIYYPMMISSCHTNYMKWNILLRELTCVVKIQTYVCQKIRQDIS